MQASHRTPAAGLGLGARALLPTVVAVLVPMGGWCALLGDLLGERPAPWPGSPLRLDIGPATGGTWSTPAWGDVNGDGRPDLVLGSAYGDVIAYPDDGTGRLGPPFPLLLSELPTPGVSLRPAVPCLTDLSGTGALDLVLLFGDRLVTYRAGVGGFTGGREMRTREGTSMGAALEEAGARGPAVGLAAEAAPRRFLLSTETGELWRLEVLDDGALAAPAALVVDGKALRLPEGARICLGDADGDGEVELIAAGKSRVYLCQPAFDGFGEAVALGGDLLTPDGVEPWALAPALVAPGKLLLGTAWGPVMTAEVRAGAVVVTGWVMATRPPMDVGLCAAPWACEWNGDGHEDVVAAGADGLVRVFVARDGGLYAPGVVVGDAGGPIRAAGGELRPCFPALADLDCDGDLDLLLGEEAGRVRIWRNGGTFAAAGDVAVAGTAIGGPGIAVPLPVDWDGDGDCDLLVGSQPAPRDWAARPGASPPFPPVMYMENEARGKSLPQLGKMVLVDFLAGRGEAHGDAAVLEPWQLWMAGNLQLGDAVMVLGRAGVFEFSLATVGPAYPRFVLAASSDVVRPRRPRGVVWCLRGMGPLGDQPLVGLGPYGFVCAAGKLER